MTAFSNFVETSSKVQQFSSYYREYSWSGFLEELAEAGYEFETVIIVGI